MMISMAGRRSNSFLMASLIDLIDLVSMAFCFWLLAFVFFPQGVIDGTHHQKRPETVMIRRRSPCCVL